MGVISAFVLFSCVCDYIAEEKRLKVKQQYRVGWTNNVVERDLAIMNRMDNICAAFYSPECLKPECIEFREKNQGLWNFEKGDE